MLRLRAIMCSLWFGCMYWRIYEVNCHFKDGYWRHMIRNLKQAWLWIAFKETQVMREFETNTNTSWCGVNWFGGLVGYSARRTTWQENSDCKIQFYSDGTHRLLFRKQFATYQQTLHSKTDDLSFIGGGHGASGDAWGL